MTFGTKNKAIVAVVVIFALASIFGVHFSMLQDEQGNMGACPFMYNTASLCHMGAAEHIQAWQTLFTGIPQKVFDSLLILLLAAIILFAFSVYRRWQFSSLHLFMLYKLYIKEHPHLSFFNPLKEAFSQGILNPQIYI